MNVSPVDPKIPFTCYWQPIGIFPCGSKENGQVLIHMLAEQIPTNIIDFNQTVKGVVKVETNTHEECLHLFNISDESVTISGVCSDISFSNVHIPFAAKVVLWRQR